LDKVLYLTSLYYLKDRVTGANKRFDELGIRHLNSGSFKVYVIVQKGERPVWCPEESVIYINSYKSKIQRLISWLQLSLVLLRLPKGIVYSDFQPIPLFLSVKHCHYQLIHDLRNWTDFARGGLGKFSALFQRWQLRKANKIVTVSEFSKQDIIEKCEIPAQKIFVSYNGITDDYCFNTSRSYIYDFIYIATFEPRKNHINLIKAIEKIQEPVRLCLIGRDLGSLSEIKKYIEASKSDNLKSITFIESIEEVDLIKLYQGTKVFVSPSYLEGFGMPLIEAAACGSRVCCSDIGVFHEIMGDSAYYFLPDSIDSIKHSLLESLCVSNNKNNLNIEKFRWDSISNDIESEFLSVRWF
jgi:glycosyltransferase involved in cell wall biosynthesis